MVESAVLILDAVGAAALWGENSLEGKCASHLSVWAQYGLGRGSEANPGSPSHAALQVEKRQHTPWVPYWMLSRELRPLSHHGQHLLGNGDGAEKEVTAPQPPFPQ